MRRIRLGGPEDAAALAEIHVTTWQTAYRGMLGDSFLDSIDSEPRRRWWDRHLKEGNPVHVAMDGGRVVGFCTAGASDEAGWGEVFAIYVLPSHWGRGLGHDLLSAGEETIRGLGLEQALLWVLERNERARNFYEGHGWVLGRPVRVEDIGGTQVTELRYEKTL